ncbi:hypothetical protein BKA81DRAFT_437138 [Phyllosticta paracitricarpa]
MAANHDKARENAVATPLDASPANCQGISGRCCSVRAQNHHGLSRLDCALCIPSPLKFFTFQTDRFPVKERDRQQPPSHMIPSESILLQSQNQQRKTTKPGAAALVTDQSRSPTATKMADCNCRNSNSKRVRASRKARPSCVWLQSGRKRQMRFFRALGSRGT